MSSLSSSSSSSSSSWSVQKSVSFSLESSLVELPPLAQEDITTMWYSLEDYEEMQMDLVISLQQYQKVEQLGLPVTLLNQQHDELQEIFHLVQRREFIAKIRDITLQEQRRQRRSNKNDPLLLAQIYRASIDAFQLEEPKVSTVANNNNNNNINNGDDDDDDNNAEHHHQQPQNNSINNLLTSFPGRLHRSSLNAMKPLKRLSKRLEPSGDALREFNRSLRLPCRIRLPHVNQLIKISSEAA